MHEAKLHRRNSFITLTFDDEHLPENWSISKRDVQLFFKALRNRVGPVRYFACGEYGDKHGRPHYHAALFGVDFAADRIRIEDTRTGFPQWMSPTLSAAWKNQGRATIGELTFESAAYVARYCIKKVTGDQARDHYWKVDPETGEAKEVAPEFTLMSRGGRGGRGLGFEWYRKYGKEWYGRDQVVVRGKPSKPPRYYDKQLEKEDPEFYEYVKARRRADRAKRPLDDDDRLAQKEAVAKAGMARFKRNKA